MTKPQPSEAMEVENAAYVFSKHCLKEHLDEVRKGIDNPTDSQWQEIEWSFERVKRAYNRHREIEKARLGK